jgi:hypothetical protein
MTRTNPMDLVNSHNRTNYFESSIYDETPLGYKLSEHDNRVITASGTY